MEVHGDIGSPCEPVYAWPSACVRVRAYAPPSVVCVCTCAPQRRRVVDPAAHSALHVFQTTQNTTCLGNALQAVSNLI